MNHGLSKMSDTTERSGLQAVQRPSPTSSSSYKLTRSVQNVDLALMIVYNKIQWNPPLQPPPLHPCLQMSPRGVGKVSVSDQVNHLVRSPHVDILERREALKPTPLQDLLTRTI